MRRFIGLISGTSADGATAALILLKKGRPVQVEAFATVPFPAALRKRVLAVSGGSPVGATEIATLDVELGECFARAALGVARQAGVAMAKVEAIGSHGQTIHHHPSAKVPATLQIGDPSVIAERTGVTVVADFRRRDVAAGGEGAPLVPRAHFELFGAKGKPRTVQNLGGIGNVTVLPGDLALRGVFAFDTGPANMILDALASQASGGKQRFDTGGRLSAGSAADEKLLARLLRDPFFKRPPPKSTGREFFGGRYVKNLLEERVRRALSFRELQATCAELTARSIALAHRWFILPKVKVRECFLCGGGVHNRDLVARIARSLKELGVETRSTAELGIDPEAVEAVAFALLARETLDGRSGNLPGVTGAKGLRVLGAIVPR